MNEPTCHLDENGVCKDHGPGTSGEAAVLNQALTHTLNALKPAAMLVADIIAVVRVGHEALEAENARLTGLGLPTLNPLETRLFNHLSKLGVAFIETITAIKAERIVDPMAS